MTVENVTCEHPSEIKLTNQTAQFKSELRRESEESYQRGYQDAVNLGSIENQKLMDAFEKIELDFLYQVSGAIEGFVDQMRPQLVELALKIAQKFVEESAVDRDFLESEVKAALDNLHDEDNLEVLLHDSDYEAFSKNGSRLFRQEPGDKQCTMFRKSPSVKAGEFMIKGNLGTHDYTRSTRFKLIARELEVAQ